MASLQNARSVPLASRSPKSRKSLGQMDHDKENWRGDGLASAATTTVRSSTSELNAYIKSQRVGDSRPRAKSLGGSGAGEARLYTGDEAKHDSTRAKQGTLSPRRAARRSLVPGRSILKALSSSNLQNGREEMTADFSQVFDRRFSEVTNIVSTRTEEMTFPQTMPASWHDRDDQTGNYTIAFDSRVATSTGDEPRSRKSLNRRVSFAATAHVRLFEREQDMTPERSNASTTTTPESGSRSSVISSTTPQASVRVVKRTSITTFTPNLSPRQAVRLLQQTPSQPPNNAPTYDVDDSDEDEDDEFLTDEESAQDALPPNAVESSDDEDETDLDDVRLGKAVSTIDPRALAFLEDSQDDSSEDDLDQVTRPTLPAQQTLEDDTEDDAVILGAARRSSQVTLSALDPTRAIPFAQSDDEDEETEMELTRNFAAPTVAASHFEGDQEDEETQELTMDVTCSLAGPLVDQRASSDEDDDDDDDDTADEATMDLTTAIGRIIPQDHSAHFDDEYKGFADDDDGAEAENDAEQTMELTAAFQSNASDFEAVENEEDNSDGEVTMEITQAVGQIHQSGEPAARRTSIRPRKSLGSPARTRNSITGTAQDTKSRSSDETTPRPKKSLQPSTSDPSPKADLQEPVEAEHVTLRQFLDLTGVSFMDGLTSTRRRSIMAAPDLLGYDADVFDLTEQIRRRSSLVQSFNSGRQATFGDYIVASAIHMPMLELYQFCCKELKGYISEGREVVETIEADSDLENPLVFKEWILADDTSREIMETQFKMIKTFSRLQAKQTWYAWRTKLLAPLQEVYDRNLEHFQQDQETVTRFTDTIDPLLAQLETRAALLRSELAAARSRKAKLDKCDRLQLSELNSAVQEQNLQIGLLTTDLKEQDLDAQYAKEKLVEIREEKQALLSEIDEAEKLTEELKSFTQAEVFNLDDKFHDIANVLGWKVIKLGLRKAEMIYQESWRVSLDYDDIARPSAQALAIDWVTVTPPRHDFELCQGFTRSLTDHLSKSRQLAPRNVLRQTVLAWQELSQLREEISMLRLKYPTESTFAKQEVKVKTTVLMPVLKAKVVITFAIPLSFEKEMTVRMDDVSSEVDLIYGEAVLNIDDVKATVRQSVKLSRTREVLVSACSDVVALYE